MFNPFLARDVRCSCLSTGKPNFVGKSTEAQGCDSSAVPTHPWLAALHCAETRDAVIAHWDSFMSRDLPLYATSPSLQIRPNRMSIAPSCHTGLRIPKDVKGAMASINEPHKIIEFAMIC